MPNRNTKDAKTTEAVMPQNRLLAAVHSLSVDGKNRLVALWMSKERIAEMRSLDTLFWLDNQWDEVYQKYRNTEGFSAARLRANGHILSLVYGG